MKAKEYFQKYKDHFEHYPDAVVKDMLKDFNEEAEELAKLRNVKSPESLVAIFKEQNQKWNAVVRIVDQEIGENIIPRNVPWEMYSEAVKVLDELDRAKETVPQ